MSLIDLDCDNNPGGGGGTSLKKPYRFVSHQKACFLCRYGLKTGKDFAHFGLESGMAFEGTTGVYERIVSNPNEKEIERNMRIRNGF